LDAGIYALLGNSRRSANRDPFVGVSQAEADKYNRVIDLDVDIGAEAVDYKYVLTPER
jgi:hypothetical protein